MSERIDARRNRRRIVVAASEVFREEGVGAALDVVARRAGVGRGTLYRHFPDRASLLAAVLEERVELLESFAAEHEGEDLLERLVVEISWYQADMPGLVAALNASAVDAERLAAVSARTVAMLRRAYDDARAAGGLREDVTLDDVLLATAMVGGVASAASAPGGGVGRALQLAFRGLRSEGRLAAPVPPAELRSSPS
ncbi:TetR/AcrR family transcriptional regulator [Actinotalea sp. Marseille-Q4924]|uniref:TetR/AcrR family transcriptional regulator n=1 Tax=Actinotalea sp. Marseille-Q4924 TaxID=2866571 RepID=UPI001CE4202B|nr:TetR/AcrR family transcriptional regulator [Actinotalea sp. Marseille-Q4924]